MKYKVYFTETVEFCNEVEIEYDGDIESFLDKAEDGDSIFKNGREEFVAGLEELGAEVVSLTQDKKGTVNIECEEYEEVEEFD